MAISKIKNGGVDSSVITSKTALGETANDADVLLVYDTSAGDFKKVTKSNISPTAPTVTSAAETAASGYLPVNESSTFTITGTNFIAGVPRVSIFQSSVGTHTDCSVVVRDSSTQLTCTVTAPATGDYFVRVENPDGLAGVSSTAVLQASPGPIWQTASGSLGSVTEGQAGSFTVAAATTDSVTVTFSETTSVLSGSGFSLNTSTGVISGTASAVSADTTYTFTIRATDTESQSADRQFSITVTNANYFGDGSDGGLDTTP